MDWLPNKDTKWITGLLITILLATLGTLQQDCSNSNQLAGMNARIDETNSSTNARIDETNARIDETNKILVELTTKITQIAADVAVLVGRSNRQEQEQADD